ncbi:hypothetical protein B4U37_10310 [Sutcliffiella horikoshii]|uniref:Uncharacterized protein n=1 Tax=Sutcliffiella horikoshii TaxID=79883 RepID=A0ABN4ZJK9_9BACI|nr:hypothetical protein B4U37_10310 [Sutcliffiella horikoshii]
MRGTSTAFSFGAGDEGTGLLDFGGQVDRKVRVGEKVCGKINGYGAFRFTLSEYKMVWTN